MPTVLRRQRPATSPAEGQGEGDRDEAHPDAADDRQPAALYLWTYASSVLAAAVFFDRPMTALVGGVGMGLVAVPFALSLRR